MSPRWHIKSGTLDCMSEGETPIEAFLNAVREQNPRELGLVFSAMLEGETDDGEERFGLVERALASAGLLEKS